MKMTAFLLLAIALASANSSFAESANSLQVLKELCVLEEPETSSGFDEIVQVDIKKADSISEFFLSSVNTHLIQQNYTDHTLNFAEVKALFSAGGDQAHNDLYIKAFGSRRTGNLYVEVKSYPGDNPYALIFDAYDGKTVASNQDDSISLITNTGVFNCYDLGHQ